ncbi:pilus assembly protein PilC [Pseudoxanthomonas broegbernensis]|uniref:Pilus assembly protein PilC n=2 Tax=Pseudoxanthomonas broegbernensis TaxID=83619 RepID=A0A7V8K769_9GAMM|nr:pilus assembly protein PilC [Pseudoxanthomonas broegbernensis]
MLSLSAAVGDYDIAQKPLYQGAAEPPLMMMVMSRDERLFTKAYSDYTDLDEDGTIDTTYTDKFDYAGYFDSFLCYEYASNQFRAVAKAEGANNHTCPGARWSGNFLNWTTMSRLDIVRHVLYGGTRSTDAATTVLERAHIPNDLHAWVKIYNDNGDFTPNSGTRSYCNSSTGADSAPIMRMATGAYSEWSSTSLYQCRTGRTAEGEPSSATDYNVRVQVCAGNNTDLHETNCRRYGTSAYKPVGLLQEYGESGSLRFGLISGSYSAPRSGGVLRRNIGRFSGNGSGCNDGNEVDLATGRFCKAAGAEGIVNTLDRFKLTQWSGWSSEILWNDCNTWGILNRQGQGGRDNLNNPGNNGQTCSAWGNPVAEMYAEALRYIAGQTRTDGFNVSGDLTGLPTGLAWKDPYKPAASGGGGNSYCASCNILLLSSSYPTFDSDEIPAAAGINAATATDAVGVAEGISGSYVVGGVGATPKGSSIATHSYLCSAKNVSGLSLVRGICPDIPSMEGSYLLAGLAHKANTTDVRSSNVPTGRPAGYRNTVTTYAVALADNLPKFEIPIGDGTVGLAPLCQSNSSGTAVATDSGWGSCFLGSVGIGPKTSTFGTRYTYGRPLAADSRSGSFSLVWEDSLYGSDFDNDVVTMITYCVGDTCDADHNPNNNGSYTGKEICWRAPTSGVCGTNRRPTVAADEALIRIENLSAYAGYTLLTGFMLSGSDNDGVHRLTRVPGNDSFKSILSGQDDPPASWTAPTVMKVKLGTSSAKQLESPLWYAAKYGGFKDANNNGLPDPGEWDSKKAGVPDNYFFARNPSKLKREIEDIFRAAVLEGATTAGGGAGSRIGDGSVTVEVGFQPGPEDNPGDWTGYLRALEVTALGGQGSVVWEASSKIPAPDARDIFMVTRSTTVNAAGTVTQAVQASPFLATNLPGANNAARLQALGVPTPVPTWLGASPTPGNLVNYLRGQPVTGYRNRSSLLGDIVNSQPEIVTPQDDFGYGYWSYAASGAPEWRAGLGGGYRDFLAAKRTAGRRMIYVGANDGMLHAFDAAQGSGGGAEEFAFIPNGSLRHMYELANPNYDHRYFVDGPITVGDASFSGSGAGDWRTVLVGTTGAGGAGIAAGASARGFGSVYALDVTNPGSFDASKVLWELNAQTDDDLGFALGKPAIVPVAGAGADAAPRWVAIFGNGPNSANGAPVLYVVDLATGAVLSRLKPTSSTYASQNGLMSVAPVAVYNSEGLVDTVYAGDLQGNLWKFDLRSGTPSSWLVAFGGAPLFQAVYDGQPQPITGGIEVSSGPGGGVSVFFGTGRYFTQGDNTTSSVQSFYGIWDNLSSTPVGTRDSLVSQGQEAQGISNGYNTRGVGPLPPNPVNYGTHHGWYVDLLVEGEAAGERFIGTPTLQSGKVVFTTYVPASAICSAGGGVNWMYALDLLNGTGSMAGISLTPGGEAVCTDNCGAISLNKEDAPQAPVTGTNVFVPKLTGCDPADPACTVDELIAAEQCSFVLRAAGADPLYLPRPCGRQSWRQVR